MADITTATAAGRPARSARDLADVLRPTGRHAPGTFSPDLVRSAPEPARRWLCRAIADDAPLARRAALRMHGTIRLGRRWHDFTAEQILAPDVGFVWSARTHLVGLSVTGFDGYADGAGTMRWNALGVPIIRKTGLDVTLSALDRLAAESVLLPSSLVDARWREAVDPDEAEFAHRVSYRSAPSHVTITVAPDGRLRRVRMQRWGSPLGTAYERQPFDVTFDSEYDASTLRVPDGIRASWPDAGGEFFRASLDDVDVD